jgi:hypothetical protein
MNSFANSKEGQQRIAEDAYQQLVNALEQTEVKTRIARVITPRTRSSLGCLRGFVADLFITYLSSNLTTKSFANTNSGSLRFGTNCNVGIGCVCEYSSRCNCDGSGRYVSQLLGPKKMTRCITFFIQSY